jgi:hypothetical protein
MSHERNETGRTGETRKIKAMKNLIHSGVVVLVLSITLSINGCSPISSAPLQTNTSAPPNTLEANALLSTDTPYPIAEVEQLAGFDVQEPTYLPAGVTFDFASYQESPHPNVTLRFKITHETYGDMGTFFQIVQQPQADAFPNPTACGETGDECELLQTGDVLVQYRLTSPTETLMWEAGGFSFQLLRTAGEPNKTYKDELLNVVASMQ